MAEQFLLITLAAPIASYGDLAGHERRGSRDRPGKSAILGLLGAALGIRRDDKEGQQALFRGYDIGVRVEHPGEVLQDFHTAQAVPGSRIKQPQTRKQALAALKRSDNAELTRRTYRTNSLHIVAIEARSEASWSLEALQQALRHPVFTLYLGRKSCPLSLPLDPRLVEAETMLEALKHHSGASSEDRANLQSKATARPRGTPYIALSAKPGQPDGARIERTNDQPLDRVRWHFGERHEAVYPVLTEGEKQ